MKNKIKMAFVYLIGFTGLGFWMYYGFLYNSFILNPKNPSLKFGFVIPFQAKGNTVYLTSQEFKELNFFFDAGLGLFVAYAILFSLISRVATRGLRSDSPQAQKRHRVLYLLLLISVVAVGIAFLPQILRNSP